MVRPSALAVRRLMTSSNSVDSRARVPGYAGDVPSRPLDAGDEALTHGVDAERHHDRDRRGGLFGGSDHGDITCCHDHVHLEPNKLGRKVGEPLDLSFGPPLLDGNRLALNPTKVTKAFTKCPT
jgi:hypothetical protein